MQKPIKIAEKIITSIEEKEINIFTWLGTFIAIITARIFIDKWIFNLKESFNILSFYDFFNSFLIIALLLFFILRIFLKIEFKKSANIILWGYFLILFPPILNKIIFGDKLFISFYILDNFPGLVQRYFTFFGDRPDFGITYGIRIQILLATILFFFYAFIKTRKFLKSFFISILTYSILFFFGTFPSWIALLIEGFSQNFWEIPAIRTVQIFFTPLNLFSREISNISEALMLKVSLNYIFILSAILLIGAFLYQKEKFWAFIKNARIIQIIFHIGLFFVGIGLGLIFNSKIFSLNYFNILGLLILIEAIILSWLASVILNDIIDQKIDRITNLERPLIKGVFSLYEYKVLGWFLFGFAIYIANLINPRVAFLLVIYQIFAYFYSAWPFRFKRFAFLSTLTSAIALLMILFSGYILISPAMNLKNLPSNIIWLLVIGYTISLPIKDFKDIKGDRADKVYTVPVIFGENWGKIITGGGIFISFILSVVLLNEPKLFWWAIIFGSIAFWMANKMRPKQKNIEINPRYKINITYQNIFWWIMGVVSVYGIILVKIIFF